MGQLRPGQLRLQKQQKDLDSGGAETVRELLGLGGTGAGSEDGLLWGQDRSLETPKYLREQGCEDPNS